MDPILFPIYLLLAFWLLLMAERCDVALCFFGGIFFLLDFSLINI